MAEDGDTLKVRMLRFTGKDASIHWFEYRPHFLKDVVRIEWEEDTMDVELDKDVADYLLRAGYAAPLPQGSPPTAAPPPVAPEPRVEETPPPPATPSWLKPSGGNQ